jgi:hypothetical protein
MKELPRYEHCFVCGVSNNSGTNITWANTGDFVQGEHIGQKKNKG